MIQFNSILFLLLNLQLLLPFLLPPLISTQDGTIRLQPLVPENPVRAPEEPEKGSEDSEGDSRSLVISNSPVRSSEASVKGEEEEEDRGSRGEEGEEEEKDEKKENVEEDDQDEEEDEEDDDLIQIQKEASLNCTAVQSIHPSLYQ